MPSSPPIYDSVQVMAQAAVPPPHVPIVLWPISSDPLLFLKMLFIIPFLAGWVFVAMWTFL